MTPDASLVRPDTLLSAAAQEICGGADTVLSRPPLTRSSMRPLQLAPMAAGRDCCTPLRRGGAETYLFKECGVSCAL